MLTHVSRVIELSFLLSLIKLLLGELELFYIIFVMLGVFYIQELRIINAQLIRNARYNFLNKLIKQMAISSFQYFQIIQRIKARHPWDYACKPCLFAGRRIVVASFVEYLEYLHFMSVNLSFTIDFFVEPSWCDS